MAVTRAPITGSVLRWALVDAGASPAELAQELSVPRSDVDNWLVDVGGPTTTQLRELAKRLHRSTSFFFLPEPPKSRPTKVQFRTYAASSTEPGNETLEGIKLAQRVQKTTLWVRDRLGRTPVDVPRLNVGDGVEEAAERLRLWLDWSVHEQTRKNATATSATKAFRNALQARGVLVLHLTLNEGSTRGFSLPQAHAPLIAANTRDHQRARLFSYAHELVHLGLGEQAVCGTKGRHAGIERFCNQVGSALLMPEGPFREYMLGRFASQRLNDMKHVVAMRNRFKVSLRAAAIRAETLGMAPVELYDEVDKQAEPRSSGGRYVEGSERTRPRIRVDEYGHEFISTLAEAEDGEVLKRVQVLQLLRLTDIEYATAKRLAQASANE